MKTYLTYGFLKAAAVFVLLLVLFVCGLQSDAAHLTLGNSIFGVGRLVLGLVFIVLGVKARRSAVPLTEAFGYGWAFGAGVAVQLFSSLFGAVTTYLYLAVINPNFTDLVLQVQSDKLQAKGVSQDQIDRMQHVMHIFSSPAAQTATNFVSGVFFGTIFALIVAAFLKREAAEPPLAI